MATISTPVIIGLAFSAMTFCRKRKKDFRHFTKFGIHKILAIDLIVFAVVFI